MLVEHDEEAFHCAVDNKLLSIVVHGDTLVVAVASWRGASARGHRRNQTELTWLIDLGACHHAHTRCIIDEVKHRVVD